MEQKARFRRLQVNKETSVSSSEPRETILSPLLLKDASVGRKTWEIVRGRVPRALGHAKSRVSCLVWEGSLGRHRGPSGFACYRAAERRGWSKLKISPQSLTFLRADHAAAAGHSGAYMIMGVCSASSVAFGTGKSDRPIYSPRYPGQPRASDRFSRPLRSSIHPHLVGFAQTWQQSNRC